MGHHTALIPTATLETVKLFHLSFSCSQKPALLTQTSPPFACANVHTENSYFPILIFNSLCDAHSEDLVLCAELPEAWLHVPLAVSFSTPVSSHLQARCLTSRKKIPPHAFFPWRLLTILVLFQSVGELVSPITICKLITLTWSLITCYSHSGGTQATLLPADRCLPIPEQPPASLTPGKAPVQWNLTAPALQEFCLLLKKAFLKCKADEASPSDCYFQAAH